MDTNRGSSGHDDYLIVTELPWRDPNGFRMFARGARERESAATHLLLHREKPASASTEELAALKNYVHGRGWSSMYHHEGWIHSNLQIGRNYEVIT